MKHLPHDSYKKDIFYLRPLVKVDVGDNEGVWYSSVPVGKNKLATIIPVMCKTAEIRGHKTNQFTCYWCHRTVFSWSPRKDYSGKDRS